MELKAGDIFCTTNPMLLARAILAVQRFQAVDNRAEYSHAGIILGPNGTTFEALWRNQRQGLFHAHGGRRVLIGRSERMDKAAFDSGWARVSRFEGRRYAGHRLFLNLVPPLAKYLATGNFAVCSELAALFLVGANCLDFWMGVSPDCLADMIARWKGWSVVYEGILPGSLEEFRSGGAA